MRSAIATTSANSSSSVFQSRSHIGSHLPTFLHSLVHAVLHSMLEASGSLSRAFSVVVLPKSLVEVLSNSEPTKDDFLGLQ